MRTFTCYVVALSFYISLGTLAVAYDKLQPDINEVIIAARKAADWLLSQRNSNLDWGRSKNIQAVLALSRSAVNISSAELQCAIKELDINFLQERLREGELELYSQRLLPLITTLVSLCRSPHNYYDFNLLDGLLGSRQSNISDFTFAVEILTVCSGDGVINRQHIRKLVWLMETKLKTRTLDIDTVSMAVMAAGCIANNYGQQNILSLANQVVNILLTKQEDNGSFDSNIVSTALAVQALKTEGLAKNLEESIGSATAWLLSIQDHDGSFDSDFLSTTEVMLALSQIGGRSRVNLRNCGKDTMELGSLSSTHYDEKNVLFQCQIWVGQPVMQQHGVSLKIPANSTVYEALVLAQSEGLIRFETREYSFGHYLESINNIVENESSNHHRWIIYIFPPSSKQITPKKKFRMKSAISSYKFQDGDRILFWYKAHNHQGDFRT